MYMYSMGNFCLSPCVTAQLAVMRKSKEVNVPEGDNFFIFILFSIQMEVKTILDLFFTPDNTGKICNVYFKCNISI